MVLLFSFLVCDLEFLCVFGFVCLWGFGVVGFFTFSSVLHGNFFLSSVKMMEQIFLRIRGKLFVRKESH